LVNEESAERAFAGGDLDMRYHFNLPSTLLPTDQLVVSYDTFSWDASGGDPRFGVEVWVNSVKVMDELVLTPDMLDRDIVTAPFTLASVNAVTGPGADNIVSLRGISYNAEGGGNWLGFDYIALDPLPKPALPIQIGRDDNEWPAGNGGGPNASFVQENGTVNDLPGNPSNQEVNQQSDNDYYMAGVYTNVIPANGAYEGIGIVPRNEESAERAFVASNPELRYHFNLPSTLTSASKLQVTFDALNLEGVSETVFNPRWGIEVYVNGVLVQPEILITTNELDDDFTTRAFTVAEVSAGLGSGHDNIVTLKGVDYGGDGGGGWMGIDYLRIHAEGDVGGTAPAFTSTVLSGGNITLTWTGTGTLESSPALGTAADWDPVTPAPTGNTYTAPATTGNLFYRIRR
jgi:hypothetical protein